MTESYCGVISGLMLFFSRTSGAELTVSVWMILGGTYDAGGIGGGGGGGIPILPGFTGAVGMNVLSVTGDGAGVATRSFLIGKGLPAAKRLFRSCRNLPCLLAKLYESYAALINNPLIQ
ncbi:MAG: hypothetical protein ACR5LF_00890 [Symbiopectobacterium sp.]